MILKKQLFVALSFILLAGTITAQENKPPFYNDIQAFKKADSLQAPAKNQVLFVGSSSFTKWTDVQNYFPLVPIINRGFGGSTLPDVTRYAGDIIFPYHPKQIVIYCGENDVAASDTISSETVVKRFVTLFNLVRSKMPKVPIIFISLKPSPSRWKLHDKMIAANDAIKEFLSTKKKTVFIDVYHKMLGPDGLPMKDIFLPDKLHMNASGYAIWQKEIAPFLLK